MLTAIIVVLIILWLLGYVHISGFPLPDITLFSINNHQVTLWELLTFVLIGWAISILPSPLQEIVTVLFILWILSLLGILAISGLSGIIVIAIIVGLIISLFA